jgi:hypothetical protein
MEGWKVDIFEKKRQTQELWMDKDGHLLHARLSVYEERRWDIEGP